MIPTLVALYRRFFFDGTFFLRTVRSLLGAYALGGIGFAKELAVALDGGSPWLIKWIRIGAVCSGFASLMLAAGDKTTPATVTAALAKTPPEDIKSAIEHREAPTP